MAHDQNFYDYLFLFFAYSGILAWSIIGYIVFCIVFKENK